MALPIPNIDDRRYADLMRALLAELPRLSLDGGTESGFDAWSDHNASQTGIAVTELLAAMGEMMLYRCDYINEEVETNFLRLVLDRPEPVTARVRFVRATPSVALAALPGGVVFPTEIAGRILFTGSALEFRGLMSETERDALVVLDPNPPPTAYTNAVMRLYELSNRAVEIPAGTQLGTPAGERFETVDSGSIPAGASRVDITARHLAVDAPFDLMIEGTPVTTSGVASERFPLETRDPADPERVLPILLEPLRARIRSYNPNPRISVTPPPPAIGPPAPAEQWEYVPDFLEAGPDAVFTIDPLTYELVFGDGRQGRIPVAGSTIRVEHLQRVHGPEAQAVAAQLDRIVETTASLAIDPGLPPGSTHYDARRNRLVQTAPMSEAERVALLALSADPAFQGSVEALFEASNLAIGSPADLPASLGTHPILATGGRYLFDRRNAERDGLAALRNEDRTVSTRDFEARLEIAFNEEIPDGPRIHKVHARRMDNLGTIMVVVLPTPGLADRWPVTSELLRVRVQRYLETRRLITTRVVIRSPVYRSFGVEIQLRAETGTDVSVVRERAIEAVFRLFDPFEGGPDSTGWPMGRPIHRSEIFQRLHETDGVSQVPTLVLLSAGSPVSSIELGIDGLPKLERAAIQLGVLS
jgi:hypothetical protein